MEIGINTILLIAIGTIVFIVLLSIFFSTVTHVWDFIGEKFGFVSYSKIERGIICSYYVCKYGCNSPEFSEFCNIEKIGQKTYEEVCSLPIALGIDEKGKICSNQFPIKVELSKEEELSKEKIKDKFDTKNLIIATERTDDWLKVVWNSAFLDVISFPISVLKNIKTEKYHLSFGYLEFDIDNAITYAFVKPGSYYIFSTFTSNIFGDRGYRINVSLQPSYIVLSSNQPKNTRLYKDQILRIQIEDEKTEDLISFNYILKVAEIYPNYYARLEFYNSSNKESPQVSLLTSDSDAIFKTRLGEIKIKAFSFGNDYVDVSISYTKEVKKEIIFLPDDKDAWTEIDSFLRYWYAYYKKWNETEKKVGGRSLFVLDVQPFFYYSDAYPSALDLTKYDKVHLWFKNDYDGWLTIYFDDGNPPYDVKCELGEYKKEYGWKEYEISLKDCNWNNINPESKIIIIFSSTNSVSSSGYIDGLYLCSGC